MRDFTLKTYQKLLQTLLQKNYTFFPFAEYIKTNQNSKFKIQNSSFVILRHDVDRLPQNSLITARLEHSLGIRGSYYFRIVPESFDETVIREIAALGHEIGYHYEDVDLAGKILKQESRTKNQEPSNQQPATSTQHLDLAIRLFREHLAQLRALVPVATICMHGSPLSKYDNRILWEKYDYRDYGIIGEPYFDVDFSKVLYLTDTGRRWDGEKVSVRDKVKDTRSKIQDTSEEEEGRRGRRGQKVKKSKSSSAPEELRRTRSQKVVRNSEHYEPGTKNHEPGTMNYEPTSALRASAGEAGTHSVHHSYTVAKVEHPAPFHSTFDIIRAAQAGRLPQQIMITVHPQRWTDKPGAWVRELLWQSAKNLVKKWIIHRRNKSQEPSFLNYKF